MHLADATPGTSLISRIEASVAKKANAVNIRMTCDGGQYYAPWKRVIRLRLVPLKISLQTGH